MNRNHPGPSFTMPMVEESGASRALLAAKLSTNLRDSSFQLRGEVPVARRSSHPFPVLRSSHTDTTVHLGRWFRRPIRRKAHRNVTHGQLGIERRETSVALSSFAEIARSMSRSFALHATVAPASRHTLASVRSGARARVLSLTARGSVATSSVHFSRHSTTCRCNQGSEEPTSQVENWFEGIRTKRLNLLALSVSKWA